MFSFPEDFLWGAATAAHQVEGNNSHNDWWEWEKRFGLKDLSGQACRHYELYREDFALARQLNHSAHRFSVEWSRIEPEEGNFSLAEIDHYREVIKDLRARQLEPIVTLHHFTNPLWFSKLGGWTHKDAPRYFLRFARKIAEELGEQVSYWVTINEPLVYVYNSYLVGVWPPQGTSIWQAKAVNDNFISAHIKTYRMIHETYRKKGWSRPSVSIAKHLRALEPCVPDLKSRLAVYLRNKIFNFDFIETLLRAKTLDFIGINYYTRDLLHPKNWGIREIAIENCHAGHHPLKKNFMDWDIYPQGLYKLLLRLRAYGLPVMILENGICTENDAERWDYIRGHLASVGSAMQKGVKVSGYIYWSLLDNFEWDKGFTPRFGLIEVDYTSYKRTVRESALKFAAVCKNNRLD